MGAQICIQCKTRPVAIKKRGLCQSCYMKAYRENKIKAGSSFPVAEGFYYAGEMDFIRNYFTHNEWVYNPATFHLTNHMGEQVKYSPDFYDVRRDVFIEVSATRQAYFANAEKYRLLKAQMPKLKFEVRTNGGAKIDPLKAINAQINKKTVVKHP